MQENRRIIINDIVFEDVPFENESVLEDSEFIYTTHFWINFLIGETKGKPILLKITRKGVCCYFIGILFKKMGLKICGSPFEGWSTPYMGFLGIDKFDESQKALIIKATIKYLLKKKHCFYVQICDWNIDIDFANRNKFKYELHETYFLDISPTEDQLFASFKTDVRTNCRNFLKRGAFLVEEEPSEKFCDDYYNQLVKVFEKQNLKSFYSKEKISRLLDSFSNNLDYIFCENVYSPEKNNSIATGIFFGFKKRCYFFGAASYSEYQILRPNEYVIWNAIKYWKSKGCSEFDMLGLRDYKKKFCPSIVQKPIIYSSAFPFIHIFKLLAKKLILKFRKKH